MRQLAPNIKTTRPNNNSVITYLVKYEVLFFRLWLYRSHYNCEIHEFRILISRIRKKVKVGNDQEMEQLERLFHSKNRGGGGTKLTVMYLYEDNI